eukprot:1562777-Pleurochrysis_carterae.AAC.1
MREQLRLSGTCGGAPFHVAIPAMRSPSTLHSHIVAAYADAATDSHPPGMGGYCQGLFWYCELEPVHILWLQISALELLATGFNAIGCLRRRPLIHPTNSPAQRRASNPACASQTQRPQPRLAFHPSAPPARPELRP